MKYASFILISLLLSSLAFAAPARTITSFSQSEAITAVAQFMYDVAEDVPVGARISDKKVNIKEFTNCTEVSAAEVLADTETTIKRVLRFYPDEEIPFAEALVDLEDYLDHRNYKKCLFEKKSLHTRTNTIYYADLSDKIHLRVDNIALTAE